MPIEVSEGGGRAKRCDVCGRLIREAVIVKTCCNNKARTFCSQKCYSVWKREWLRRQEQLKGGVKRPLL